MKLSNARFFGGGLLLSTVLATLIPCAGARAAAPAGKASLNDIVNQSFQLSKSTIITLAVNPIPDVQLTTPILLDGVLYTLDMQPHSVRDANYQCRAQLADGSWQVAAPGPLRTLRGTLLELPGSIAAGSLLEDGLHLVVRMPEGDRLWVEPVASHVPGAKFDQYVVYRSSDVIAQGGICGVNDAGDEKAAVDEGGIAGGVLKCAQLGCDADFEFYQAHGSSVTNVEDRINLVINTVNVQYENEVNIRHQITTILVRTAEPDPYTSTDSGTLLNQFRTEWQNNQGGIQRDVAHLFTGKSIDGTVIGIAFTPGVCTPSNGYSLVQSDCCGPLSCSTDLSAHELGHNWSASHCTCPSNTMNPSIACANVHAASSITQITNYLNSIGCVSNCEVGTTTLPFFDDFPTTTIDPAKWTGISGAFSNASGTNEPSAPNSLNLDGSALGGDEVRSAIINAANMVNFKLSYAYERKGGGDQPEANDDLVVEFLDASDNWVEVSRQFGNGPAMTNYTTVNVDFPPAASHANFRLRFRAISSQNGLDDWFVDNVSMTGALPPLNDNCSGATFVTGGSFAFSTLGASTDGPNEPAGCNFNGFTQIDNDVWFKFGALCTGTATATLCGADYDAKMAVYPSTCPVSSGTAIACNDNFCGLAPQITFPVTANTIYRIRIGGTNGARGTGTFTVSCTPTPTCLPDIAPPGGDSQVNIDDLLGVINAWGATSGPADINHDNIVNIDDLLAVINAWGPCP